MDDRLILLRVGIIPWTFSAYARSILPKWERNLSKKILRAGFEPATYGCLMFHQLQSTALPTELSKGDY